MNPQYPLFLKQFQSAKNELLIQRCPECGTLQYPPREVCKTCLHHELEWKVVSPKGKLLSWTLLHTSLEPAFQGRFPWAIGEVKLDCGTQLMVHVDIPEPVSYMRVVLETRYLFEGIPMYFALKNNKK